MGFKIIVELKESVVVVVVFCEGGFGFFVLDWCIRFSEFGSCNVGELIEF